MTPELLGEILGLLMFAGACGLLILGYPVALTLAGAGLLFAALGNLLGVFQWNLLGGLPSRRSPPGCRGCCSSFRSC